MGPLMSSVTSIERERRRRIN